MIGADTVAATAEFPFAFAYTGADTTADGAGVASAEVTLRMSLRT